MKLPHERFDYSPIAARRRWTLPRGARIAVWTIVNVEEWDIEKPMPRGVLSAPQGVSTVPDVPNWAWHDYGMRVGFWRMLDALKKRKIRATTAINANVCRSYEPVARAMLDLGWEFMGHAVKQGAMHLVPDQREAIRTAVAMLREFTGKKPRGWLGPGLTETWETLDILAEEGIEYVSDWVNDDQPYEIKTTAGPLVSVPYTLELNDDFTGSHAQVPGPVNSSYTALVSAVRAIYLAITNPSNPVNDGAFRSLETICPAGTIFSAERPAPVSTYWETMLYVADLLWRAMAPHLPDRMTAGHFLSVCGTVVSGPHPDTGELYLLVEPLAGGWGAGRSKDGERGLVCIGDGETYMIPVEVAETRYGIRVDQYAFHSEEGGAGRYRGGNGLVRDYRITSDEAYLTTTFGRHKYLPWGADGGREGTPNYVQIIQEDGPTERFGKTARFRLRRGEVARLVTGTGGGWGEPTQRPLEDVLDDVRGGYVTVDQAERDYGVAIDPETGDGRPSGARIA